MDVPPPKWIDGAIDNLTIIRATRLWVQYGIFGFAVFCILIGAVEALLGQ
jgi:hypothetical protein